MADSCTTYKWEHNTLILIDHLNIKVYIIYTYTHLLCLNLATLYAWMNNLKRLVIPILYLVHLRVGTHFSNSIIIYSIK